MSALAISIAFLATAAASLRWLPPLHPVQLFAVPWAAASTLYSLRLIPYGALDPTTAAMIAWGAGAFMLGALFVSLRLQSRLRARPWRLAFLTGLDRLLVLKRAALGVLALSAGWLLAFLAQVSSTFGLRAALVSSPEVRRAIASGATSLTVKYVYATLAATLLCAVIAAKEPDLRARHRWLGAALACGMATYFTTGRANLVTAALFGAVAYALAARPAPSRRMLALSSASLVVLAVAVLILGGGLIGKTFNNAELSTVDSVFTDHREVASLALPYQYVTAPIAAFNELVEIQDSFTQRTDGCATAAVGCAVLAALGADSRAEPSVRPFTGRPLPWNTYTALDAPLLDGGKLLLGPIMGLLGAMAGAAWAFSARGTGVSVLVYAVVAVAIISSVVQNNFLAPHYLGALGIALSALLLAGLSAGRAERPA
jgi:oligosaccharide repeat unit polymerase